MHLTGEQAVVYARLRKIDSDVARSNRQKKVIEALLVQARKVSPSKYGEMVKTMMSLCETSLSFSEIMSFAPMISQDLTIQMTNVPNEEDNAVGGIYDGAWVWRYDLAAATERLHLFIYGEVPETTPKKSSSWGSNSSKTDKNKTTAPNTTEPRSATTAKTVTTTKTAASNAETQTQTSPETTTSAATTEPNITSPNVTTEPVATAPPEPTKSDAAS